MSHRLFTAAEEALVAQRYAAGETADAIGKDILPGRSVPGRSILNTLIRLGVEIRPSASARNPVVTETQRNEVARLCLEGLTLQDAADRVGVSKRLVSKVLSDRGIHLQVGTKRYLEVDDYAFDTLTEDSLYWLGFLFADGCVSKTGTGSDALIVGLAECDLGHVEKLKSFLKSEHAITRNSGASSKGGPSVYLKVRSQHMCDRLGELGMVTKAARIPTPEAAASRGFWRGMVDGDGSVGWSNTNNYSYPYIKLPGQNTIADAFQKFLAQQLNIRLNTYNSVGLWHVSTMGSNAVIIIKHLYRSAKTYLDRKYVTASQIIKENP